MGVKTAAISAVGLFAFACLFAFAQEKKPTAEEFKIPPEEAKRENPVKPTAASLADGKHVFASQCAMCHGKDGDGKGDLAEDMKLKLRDYRDPAALKDVTDGAMFYILTKGKGDMPGQEDRMKPEQLWNLINYIRSLAKGKAAPKTEESKPPSL
jgi:mono/diheme cytochrome c family protein